MANKLENLGIMLFLNKFTLSGAVDDEKMLFMNEKFTNAHRNYSLDDVFSRDKRHIFFKYFQKKKTLVIFKEKLI